MNVLSTVANEVLDRTLWYPTILGALVVLSAIALFFGTIYLLLATNLGSRLGFLIAAAGLSGLMVLMALLWLTNPSPVTTLKGRIPHWVAVESIESGDVARSEIPAVQQIDASGQQADDTEAANAKASVDTILVNQGGEEISAETASYAIYQDPSEYLITDTQLTGGGGIFSQFDMSVGGGFPWVHVSLHKPLYAVVTTCMTDPNLTADEVPFGDPPPEPQCADDNRQVLVMEQDLGSLRVPPFVTLLSFGILFVLCLLSLQWRERDLQEQAAAGGRPKPKRSPRRHPTPSPRRSEESRRCADSPSFVPGP